MKRPLKWMYAECTGDESDFLSENDIRYILLALNGGESLSGRRLSWQSIADSPRVKGRISRGTLSAYARGRAVVNPEHKLILGIGHKPRARRSINLRDAESAALTILESEASSDYIARLAQLLDIL